MPHHRVIVAVHRRRRVEQRRQQISLDVADIAAALFEAGEDVLDVQAVNLHEALTHKRSGIRLAGDRDRLAAGR